MLSLLDLFADFAGHGGECAMVYRTGVRRLSFSYGDLHRLVLRMNALLAARGVGEGDRVLIWGPNSPWWGIAFWGIMARGAIAVPVDFMSGSDRAESIANLTEAALVIQSDYKAERLTGFPSINLEELEFLLGEIPPLAVTVSKTPADIAQLIFTSGTTGKPKGVMLTHGNLLANLIQVNRQIPVVTPEFRFLSLLPLSHMFEQMGGFFTPLFHGSRIVYLRTLKPSAIMEAFAEEDIRAVIAVPRLLQLLRGSIEQGLAGKHLSPLFYRLMAIAQTLPTGMKRALFSPIRRRFGRHFTLFVSGGAPLSPDLFSFWKRMGFTVVEGYGLTECSPVLTANTWERQVPGSVGAPLPGVSIRLAEGEVLARGDNVFPGYYRNEAATSDAFTADGWFRTGDLGEMDSSGWLRIKGRIKELIVTGAGVNVYPDLIEPELNRTAGVREGCVIGLDRGAGEEVHGVLLLDGSGRKPEEIVVEVNARLDPLSRITGFTIWPETEFPKTTTLKIRKYLVKEEIRKGRGGEGGAAAADRLVNIIARVTGTAPAAITEGATLTSDLGLTSIAGLELVNYLEQEFRIDLEDSLIGPQTKVADLRAAIEKRETVMTRGRFRFWTNSLPVRGIRMVCDSLLNYPLFRSFVMLEAVGVERLAESGEPLFFVANHTSYLDQPSIMFALPGQMRYRTATAAWAEFFFRNYRNWVQRLWKRLCFEYGSLGLNLFPLPQSGGFRGALRFMGRLADNGISILMFPEGERTQSRSGEMLPFRSGLGIMARELGLPVVPVHISGLEYVFPRGAHWPRRGRVTVTFGDPIRFTRERPDEIVAAAEAALRRLAGKTEGEDERDS
jgi:long-chain acyl-CoA synthetase